MGKFNEFYAKFMVFCSDIKEMTIAGGKMVMPSVKISAPETGKFTENGSTNGTGSFRRRFGFVRMIKRPTEKQNAPKAKV